MTTLVVWKIEAAILENAEIISLFNGSKYYCCHAPVGDNIISNDIME